VRRRRTLWLSLAAALAAGLVLVGSGAAGPASLGSFFFGPKLVRAEVILADGGAVRDYRIDRGQVKAVGPGAVTLLERDGTTVTVPIAPNADVRLGGRAVPLARLRLATARGVTLVATTIRLGDQPAQTVEAQRSA